MLQDTVIKAETPQAKDVCSLSQTSELSYFLKARSQVRSHQVTTTLIMLFWSRVSVCYYTIFTVSGLHWTALYKNNQIRYPVDGDTSRAKGKQLPGGNPSWGGNELCARALNNLTSVGWCCLHGLHLKINETITFSFQITVLWITLDYVQAYSPFYSVWIMA